MTEMVSQDIGSEFRQAREQSGLTLRHIADATKLPTRSLVALENNRIDQLPGGIYRRAIVRSYAAHVGLDPERTLRAFLAKYPDDVPSMEQLFPEQTARSKSRALHALLSILSALIPILGGVFYFASNASGSDAVPFGASAHVESITRGMARPDPVSMMVSVSDSTRLQIVADGREVVAREIDAGEVIRLDLSSDVVLVGDNAGAVHFSINGRAGRTLGDEGEPLTARIARSDYDDWLMQP